MRTLCNKKMLRQGSVQFFNFAYVNKQRDPNGDIVTYNATLRYNGHSEPCFVSVQNGEVVAYNT